MLVRSPDADAPTTEDTSGSGTDGTSGADGALTSGTGTLGTDGTCGAGTLGVDESCGTGGKETGSAATLTPVPPPVSRRTTTVTAPMSITNLTNPARLTLGRVPGFGGSHA